RVDLERVTARRVEADGVAQRPLLVLRQALDGAAVPLEHRLVALEIVDRLRLEGDALHAVARRLSEDHRMVVVLVPALEVHVAGVALELAEAEHRGVVGGAWFEVGHPDLDVSQSVDRHAPIVSRAGVERKYGVPHRATAPLAAAPAGTTMEEVRRR